MGIILAKTAGFCFGVKRAVDKVYALQMRNFGKVISHGFNPQIC